MADGKKGFILYADYLELFTELSNEDAGKLIKHILLYVNDKNPETKDHLVIERIPDVFHGGHIHINGEGQYRGVQIVNSGTMQSQTSFQKSLNIDPTPGQISLLNLQSLQWNRLFLQ